MARTVKTKPYTRTLIYDDGSTFVPDESWRKDKYGNVYCNGEFIFCDKRDYKSYLTKVWIRAISLGVIMTLLPLYILFGRVASGFALDKLDSTANTRSSTIAATLVEDDWHGIDSAYVGTLLDYRSEKWINRTSQCGEYSGAMMLIINDSIRNGIYNETGFYDDGSALLELKNIADNVGEGTNTIELVNELKAVGNVSTQTEVVPEIMITQYIDDGYSVCLMLVDGAVGNRYGDHWVCAYAYADKDGKRYYKVCDNWGNYNAVLDGSSVVWGVVTHL